MRHETSLKSTYPQSTALLLGNSVFLRAYSCIETRQTALKTWKYTALWQRKPNIRNDGKNWQKARTGILDVAELYFSKFIAKLGRKAKPTNTDSNQQTFVLLKEP